MYVFVVAATHARVTGAALVAQWSVWLFDVSTTTTTTVTVAVR